MLQETQFVKVKVDEHEFRGPIKRMCQTFFRNQFVTAMYKGEWKSVQFTTVQETKPIIHLTTIGERNIYATEDQLILTPGGKCRFVKDLVPGDRICLEETFTGVPEDEIKFTVGTTQLGEWIFGIKVADLEAPYFALDNGIILRGDL